MIGDSSIVNKPVTTNNDSTWSKLPLWGGSPQSPTSSLKTQYHSASSHSNSKESLWHSTQSSPNSNLREQMQTSSTNSTNLWESPSSKLSQASLMFNKSDSFNSVWTIPQNESPVNKLASLWDTPNTSTPITPSYSMNKSTEGFRLIRPQDLCGTEIWSNTNTNNNGNSMNLATTQKTKEPVGSLWASPTPNYNKINSVIGKSFSMKPILARSSTPIGSSSTATAPTFTTNSNYNNLPSNGGSSSTTFNNNHNNHNNNNNTGGAAASSCLQLFSDEFLNYLNMIN